MKIFVTGTRGIPNIPGGVEKHCQDLYPHIVSSGHKVILATRTPYVKQKLKQWHGIELCYIFAPHKKSAEAIVHTFLAVLKARLMCVDIIHIHAIGPGLMVVLARLLGLRVVLTNHGPDYERSNWSTGAKIMLRLGEYLGGKFANETIVISKVIKRIVKRRCKKKSHLIYNGVSLPNKSSQTDFLKKQSIIPGKYLLAVARFVPEKGLHDLLEAFKGLAGDCQLVIAGDADHPTRYCRELKLQAKKDERVILTGYISGEDLNQVFSHAILFVLPSYHEGLPIALLEAISYELPILASDIPANKEILLANESYFRCGDTCELRKKIDEIINNGTNIKLQDYQYRLLDKYKWGQISEQTIHVYEKALKKQKKPFLQRVGYTPK